MVFIKKNNNNNIKWGKKEVYLSFETEYQIVQFKIIK